MVSDLSVAYLLDGAIRSHSIHSPAVRWDSNASVGARFQNTFTLPLQSECIPFVYCTIHTTWNQLIILTTPTNATDLDVLNRKTICSHFQPTFFTNRASCSLPLMTQQPTRGIGLMSVLYWQRESGNTLFPKSRKLKNQGMKTEAKNECYSHKMEQKSGNGHPGTTPHPLPPPPIPLFQRKDLPFRYGLWGFRYFQRWRTSRAGWRCHVPQQICGHHYWSNTGINKSKLWPSLLKQHWNAQRWTKA